jgi:hypothetical protein
MEPVPTEDQGIGAPAELNGCRKGFAVLPTSARLWVFKENLFRCQIRAQAVPKDRFSLVARIYH